MNGNQDLQIAVRHHQAGELNLAEPIYRRILQTSPHNMHALHLLGLLLGQRGQAAEAIRLIVQAIAINPNIAEFHGNLGAFYGRIGKFDQSIASFQQALRIAPNDAMNHYNLATALINAGQFEQGIAESQRALELNPNIPEAWQGLSDVYSRLGKWDQSVDACEKAIAIRPEMVEVWCNLASALLRQDRIEESLSAARRAIELSPNFAPAHYNLAVALHQNHRLDEAIPEYRQVIRLKSDFSQALNNLANILRDLGQVDEALKSLDRAIQASPNDSLIQSNRLFSSHFDANVSPQQLFEAHRQWDRQYAQPIRPKIIHHANTRDPNRRLRIGYISPDFRRHSVAYFLAPLLAHHDHSQCEIFCYADLPHSDSMTERFRGLSDHWRDITLLNHLQVEEAVRADQIDILIDLAGHSAGNRLPVFARSPAPIQVTYLGYPHSTGMTAMDYRLTDAYADPPGESERFSTEKLFRLSPTFLCFQPDDCPPVASSPNRPVTFGSFNAAAKLNDRVADAWSNILRGVPESRLFLKMPGGETKVLRDRIDTLFTSRGVESHRIDLLGRTESRDDHLQLYSQIDIALDTFPYNGTTTTCEALWMGVPVITFAGDSHRSRVGVSILNNIGLPELIGSHVQDYVHKAIELASQPERIAQLRKVLRPQISESALMDAPRFARNVDAAYRQMWQQWCAVPDTDR